MILLTENLTIPLSASIAFDWSNANELSPNPYYEQKEQTRKAKILYVCSFSVSDVFANAKVMLFATLIIMLLANARSDVMFAHCAVGTTSFTQ